VTLSPTPAPTETAAAGAEVSPTPPAVEPSPTPLPTDPAPPAGQRGEEAIMILEPASGSRVASPVRVRGIADSTFEQNLVVRVVTAEGEQVALAPTTIQSEMGQRGPFELVLPIPAIGEQNLFIQVFATSARDGGVTHLSAVGVMFAPGKETNILTRGPQPEQISIFQPRLRDVIRGGVARVEGFGLASFEQTLVAEVQDEEGRTIGSVPIMVQSPEMGQPGPFSAEVPYTLASAGPGRVVVRDISPAFGGDVHLTSVEVQLEP
jgi:hypothetical protein